MNITPSKPLPPKALTDDARHGIHRTKPLNTSLAQHKPHLNTNLASASKLGAKKPLTAHEKLVQQTQKWVAQTFYGTMLKQMRNSPFKSDLMDGGHGGQAFQSMYDQKLAEHMSRGAGAKLVNSIVHRIESRSSAVKAQAQQSRQSHAARKAANVPATL
jgi:Rod binding domain-containing protein